MNSSKNVITISLLIVGVSLSVLLVLALSSTPVLAILARTPSPTLPPVATPITTPAPTPLILTGENLSNEEISWLLFDYRYDFRHLPLAEWQAVANGRFERIVQQQVDVNGDGNSEILVYNGLDSFEPYVAILGQVDEVWKVWLYTNASGRYCGQARAVLADDKVISDFLTCGGGTGIIGLTWEQ